jgi:hypothetical protein
MKVNMAREQLITMQVQSQFMAIYCEVPVQIQYTPSCLVSMHPTRKISKESDFLGATSITTHCPP